ncbi:MAG: NAD-dependent deacylase [Pigmentiphaga sp.]|nr:NAD-dependent deacylase [Pigmentiphaga sp.]
MTDTPLVLQDAAELPGPLCERLRHARRVVVFTGAGVSQESGIATFRGDEDSLWSRYDPKALATPEAFERTPDLVWGWYEWRRGHILRARPNAAHHAIARLQRSPVEVCVVTQNVDDLHERAGARHVLHLHGRLEQARCHHCGQRHQHPEQPLPSAEPSQALLPPPRCARCKGPIRPGVVWFGEALPDADWQAAQAAVENCDVLFSVGTSSLVYPAAALPQLARRCGALVIQVNPDATPLDALAHASVRGKAGPQMSHLIDIIAADGGPGSPPAAELKPRR